MAAVQSDPNRALLERAVELLQPVLDDLVFVGGCATGLLITDPASGGIRPTKDVDAITEVGSYAQYDKFAERLRNLGFSEDTQDGVICRWRHPDVVLDVMPTDQAVLGFTNRWFAPAIERARSVELRTGTIRAITSVYFLSTKLEAFHGRSEGDYAGSHDLEDVITVIDGRPEILDEVRAADAEQTRCCPKMKAPPASRCSMRQLRSLMLAVSALAGTVLVAQTEIKLAKNKYTPQQDVELGLKAAAEIRKEYPIINDPAIQKYLTSLGDRLVAVSPAQLNQSVYRYSFTPVNLKEINAFALPGGPMFVHRGMFDAAAGEGEVIGVMAHELSHVLLRHGTANATKAQNPWLQLGQIAGAVGGAVVGGGAGALISDGSQFGLGTLLLRYSRDFEKQADLLGVQLMAKAGYDPRDLGHMFETIAKDSKGGGPQWLSSHPDPGNRTAYINKEAAALQMAARADTSGFAPTKSKFAGLPPAMTMAELAKRGETGGSGNTAASVGTPGQPVPAPSSQLKEVNGGLFVASVPSNWTTIQSQGAIKVVPQNGYGDFKGQTIFTYGVEFGVAKPSSRDLQEATSTWLKAIAQGNPDLKVSGQQQYVRISGRTALATPLTNPSPLGGAERIHVYTMFLSSGNLFYYLTIAQEADAQAYQQTFVKIGNSIKINDVK